MTYSALDIANKILAQPLDRDGVEYISNMKLQKLLYYQQGFHLAFFGTPLFDEEIEAWQYGPVVPSVYSHYASNGRRGIEPDAEYVIGLSEDEETLFVKVFEIYGDYSASGLMNMSHNETPWRTTPTGMGNIIEKSKLLEFFETRIKN